MTAPVNKQRVLVTGASGFVGRCLTATLAAAGRDVRAALRQPSPLPVTDRLESVVVGDLGSAANWEGTLNNVDSVVHLAARVHVMQDTAADPLAEFRRVNVLGTLQLARQAVAAGVRRFVFISSVKVNGEGTPPGCPYTADDVPAPVDAYGMSKLEAEQGLLELAASTGLEVVIIRPVLVYGPGVRANFLKMMQWLDRGLPLPLGAIDNRRSLLSVDNLVSLILICLEHPDAVNQVFLASDGEDLSTTALMRRTAFALGKSARLVPVPAAALTVVAGLLGKRDVAQRLCGSLQVDIAKTRRVLGWAPPLSVDAGLALAAQDFLRQKLAHPSV
jgi:nucleoside-diphosphate-sugar epimerase